MPRGDGTGPAGMGPRTGRMAGYCAGYPVPGFMNPAVNGYMRWPAGGRGRGHRWMYYAMGLPFWARRAAYSAYDPAFDQDMVDAEKNALSEQLEFLQQQIKAIQQRLDQLNKGGQEQDET